MNRGAAHVDGLYTVPSGSGTQVADGADVIWNLGLRTLKVYLTADYLTDYPLQTAWSSTPTTLTQLAQTTQMATQLARDWDAVVLTCFTFANGSTNWWRADPSTARMQAEYDELRALAEHLLTTYNGTGRTFVLQQWEGDWAFMDSTTVDAHVDSKFVGYYAAFLGTRQRAVEDARRAVASDCAVLNAIEVNRVIDSRAYASRRRILRDIAPRVRPDVVSYSAYDSTIVDQGGWAVDFAAWEAATRPVLRKALAAITDAWPGVPVQIGEFGFPENEAPVGADIDAMIRVVDDECETAGVDRLIYWEVFDNEVGGGGPGTYRGYWLRDPAGVLTTAGATMQALGP